MKAINKHFPDGLPQTILVSDRHTSYFKMDVKDHQVCLAHLHKDFESFKKDIAKCRDYIFTFLKNPTVPHHYNASEGGIRKIKVKQKISGCFRTDEGADIFMKIHYVVETAKKNGNSKFEAVFAVVEQ